MKRVFAGVVVAGALAVGIAVGAAQASAEYGLLLMGPDSTSGTWAHTDSTSGTWAHTDASATEY
ncbi:hypothetical protein [Nocardia arthritidis]|uniref:Uncharacterized protein n=1 Tax=Nocardia arthritidis TaxID=228602 RepID=A0A6G9YAR0_9NOCA|nr:hypothetical protein [Nocardia arthritidis]QIS10210.1 hypothetical protein F5544_11590 [Nocardia arthritidis]